jgi:hypothetical protein
VIENSKGLCISRFAIALIAPCNACRVESYAIGAEMKKVGLPDNFIVAAVTTANDFEGVFNLLKMWANESDSAERDAIVSDIQELIDEPGGKLRWGIPTRWDAHLGSWPLIAAAMGSVARCDASCRLMTSTSRDNPGPAEHGLVDAFNTHMLSLFSEHQTMAGH